VVSGNPYVDYGKPPGDLRMHPGIPDLQSLDWFLLLPGAYVPTTSLLRFIRCFGSYL